MAVYDPTVCNTQLTNAGYVPVCDGNIAVDHHCTDFMETPMYHTFCYNSGQIYNPVQATMCVSYGGSTQGQYFFAKNGTVIHECMNKAKSDPAGQWDVYACYCCCSCFAYGTKIGVGPDTTAAIETIAVGQTVLVGSGTGTNLSWADRAVTFSDGTAGGVQPFMVYLAYELGGTTADMIASPDQVFMTTDGTLVTARKLTLRDQLLDTAGRPVPIHTVSVGSFTGGVHHIGIGKMFDGQVDGHLIQAGGLVAGDYSLQLHGPVLDRQVFTSGHDDRPDIGTPEYDEVHGQHRRGQTSFAFTTLPDPAARTLKLETGSFAAYTPAGASLPATRAQFLTDDQSLYLLQNATFSPLGDPLVKASFENAAAHLRGLYPDITYYLDWYEFKPNVYAFENYGQKFVVITGGLMRLIGLGYEGVVTALGHGVARFMGGTPTDHAGFTGTGAADFYSFGVITRQFWFGNNWLKSAMPAYMQITKILGSINSDDAGGDSADPIEYPSLACRIEAIDAGVSGGFLPECCGGTPVPLVQLESAAATEAGMTLTLSLGVQADSAANVANYSITPQVNLKTAALDSAKDFVINLAADLEAGQTYAVTISNLQSVMSTGVDPNMATASAQVPDR